MQTRFALLAAFLLVPLAPFAAGEDVETVTVTLEVNLGTSNAPLYKNCAVTVPEDSTVGQVLDQAVVDECLLEWSAASFPGLGRYVSSIDHVREAVATYWSFWVNGAYSDYGIDSTLVEEGDIVRFSYVEWVVPYTLGTLP